MLQKFQISKERERAPSVSKSTRSVIFLGPSCAGKTTFYKQFIHWYGAGFTTTEKANAASVLKINALDQMKDLVSPTLKGVKPLAPSAQPLADSIRQLPENTKLTPEYAAMCNELLKDPSMPRRFDLCRLLPNEYALPKALYLSNPSYEPVLSDVFHARTATNTATEATVTFENQAYILVDTPVTLPTKPGWLKQFQNVSCFVYMVNLNAYILPWNDHSDPLSADLRCVQALCDACPQGPTICVCFNHTDKFSRALQRKLCTGYEEAALLENLGPLIPDALLKLISSYISEKKLSLKVVIPGFDCEAPSEAVKIVSGLFRELRNSQGVQVIQDISAVDIGAELLKQGMRNVLREARKGHVTSDRVKDFPALW